MGHMQQRKGRNGEFEICKILRANGIDARPGEPVSYGKTPDITGVTGIHCEVKRVEALRLSQWMAQARQDAEKFGDGLPAVFHRRNREGWQVTMDLADWLTLYQAAGKTESGELSPGPTGNGSGGSE